MVLWLTPTTKAWKKTKTIQRQGPVLQAVSCCHQFMFQAKVSHPPMFGEQHLAAILLESWKAEALKHYIEQQFSKQRKAWIFVEPHHYPKGHRPYFCCCCCCGCCCCCCCCCCLGFGQEDESQSTGIDDASQGSKFSCQKPGFRVFFEGKVTTFLQTCPKNTRTKNTSPKWEWIFPAILGKIRDPWGLIKKNLNCWERQVDLVGIAMFFLVFAKGFERWVLVLNWGQALKTLDLWIHILPEKLFHPILSKELFSSSGTFWRFQHVFVWTWTCWTRWVLMLGNWKWIRGGRERPGFSVIFFARFSGDEDSILTASKSAARMVMSWVTKSKKTRRNATWNGWKNWVDNEIEQWQKGPGPWLFSFFKGDYTTQLCGDYNKRL